MSNDVINAPAAEVEALPASTPEYAPAVQTVVEDVKTGDTTLAPVDAPSGVPLPPNAPELAPAAPLAVPTLRLTRPFRQGLRPSYPMSRRKVYCTNLPLKWSAAPRNLTCTTTCGKCWKKCASCAQRPRPHQAQPATTWLLSATPCSKSGHACRIQDSGFRIQARFNVKVTPRQSPIHNHQSHNRQSPIPNPTAELITETRALARAVQKEIDVVRNNTIQLQNQMQIVMGATTECLREMDKTARQYEQQEQHEQTNGTSQTSALLDQLRSLRDMLAVKFENARLEPIAPEPGDTFRLNEHRADNGFASTGKIKRTVFEGFRWTQPNPLSCCCRL